MSEAMRELTLAEYLAKLPEHHAARRECAELEDKLREARAVAEMAVADEADLDAGLTWGEDDKPVDQEHYQVLRLAELRRNVATTGWRCIGDWSTNPTDHTAHGRAADEHGR